MAPWVDNGWNDDNDWEFNSAADDTPEELYALWDGAVDAVPGQADRGDRRRRARPARRTSPGPTDGTPASAASSAT